MESAAPKFTQGGLMRHVVVMSFTSSIGVMAIFAVDFVDMIFISMLGNAALAAAIGYAGTILFFTTSISIGVSIAAGALTARSVGAGNQAEARQYATSVMMAGFIASVIIFGLVWLSMDSALDFLGAKQETKLLALDYLRIILPSMPVLMIGMVAGAVLRAYGDAKRAMYATLAGGVVNAALDPLLIFGLGLDLQGAALASVASRVTITLVSLLPAIRLYDGFAGLSVSLMLRDLRAVLAIAVPAVLANIATPIGSAIMTREMARFGTDAVAGLAVIGRLTPVAFAIILALSGAIGPIVGQNFGAGLNDRVRGSFFAALRFTAFYVVGVSVILFLLRGSIAELFSASGESLTIIYLFCGPLALSYIFNGWIFVGNATFNNLGHPFYSTWVNWGRHTVGTWPLVILGASLWGAGGVLIGQAIGGVFFAGLSIWMALRLMDRNAATPPDGPFTPEARFHVIQSRRH